MNTAPSCIGCQKQMDADGDPWLAASFMHEKQATGYRVAMVAPRVAFFCPDCEWRIDTFTDNVHADVVRLESNTPRDVFSVIFAAKRGMTDDRVQPRLARPAAARRAS